MKYRGRWHEAEASKFSASRRGICPEDYITDSNVDNLLRTLVLRCELREAILAWASSSSRRSLFTCESSVAETTQKQIMYAI